MSRCGHRQGAEEQRRENGEQARKQNFSCGLAHLSQTELSYGRLADCLEAGLTGGYRARKSRHIATRQFLGNGEIIVIDTLPPLQRLALAYAPAATRDALLVLLSLDARLAGIVRSSREPMLVQMRLAWWREQVGCDVPAPGGSDPLLAALRTWPGSPTVLAGLADGWEAMIGAAPLPISAYDMLASARAAAFAALAETEGQREAAQRMGRNWALADIAEHLSDPRERAAALELARAQDWRPAKLPRALRPLAVLHGLAARTIQRGNPSEQLTALALLAAMRIGLLGR